MCIRDSTNRGRTGINVSAGSRDSSVDSQGNPHPWFHSDGRGDPTTTTSKIVEKKRPTTPAPRPATPARGNVQRGTNPDQHRDSPADSSTVEAKRPRRGASSDRRGAGTTARVGGANTMQGQIVLQRGTGEETNNPYSGTNIKALAESQRRLFKHIENSHDDMEEAHGSPPQLYESAIADFVEKFAENNRFYLTNRNRCTHAPMSMSKYPTPDYFYPIRIDVDQSYESMRRTWFRWCVQHIRKDKFGVTAFESETIFMHMLMCLMKKLSLIHI